MQEITLATQTTFAELLQRSLAAEFDDTYRERGQFKRRLRKGRTGTTAAARAAKGQSTTLGRSLTRA
jgi:hypothetical protein